MTSESTCHIPSTLPAQTELELLQYVLQGDGLCPWYEDDANAEQHRAYPWDVSDPAAEEYLAAMEQEVFEAGWTTADLAAQGQALAATLEHAWSTITPTIAVKEAMAKAVSTDLFQQFLIQVPQNLLEDIVAQARQVIAANLSVAEQLVACVKETLPGWGEDDLQVLARPFAFAMRGAENEMLEAALRSVRCAAWTELSGIEQARLSLAIARYAIAQMPPTTNPHH
jgi:hypothetical protein